MSTRILVIDGNDGRNFSLSIDGTGLQIVGDSTHQGLFFRGVRVGRIRCEIEIDATDSLICTSSGKATLPPLDDTLPQELNPGELLQLGQYQFHLEDPIIEEELELSDLPALREESETPVPQSSKPADKILCRFVVTDGADTGQTFTLPPVGNRSIGNSNRHADIVLHDLYVSRVHCDLAIADRVVTVTHHSGQMGTLINGVVITQPTALRSGDVLRVGNSHLRMEMGQFPESAVIPEKVKVVQDDDNLRVAGADSASQIQKLVSFAHPSLKPLLQLQHQSLGHYQIGAMLGHDFTGVVFRAKDQKTNQIVALKVLSPDFPSNSAELQQFAQVLKQTLPLQHENLISFLAAGKSSSHCWIAREYVEGESVEHMIRHGQKLEWSRVCRAIIHLTRALDFLHPQQIYHHNISPKNVMVRTSDRATKLADLLLNKALEGSHYYQSILEPKLLSDLPYLAPEQTELNAFVDHLADLYSLGAVAYAMLTAQPPFAASNPEELLEKICGSEKIVKPSKFQKNVPPRFEGIILKLLSRRQEDRYQTTEELLDNLDSVAAVITQSSRSSQQSSHPQILQRRLLRRCAFR